MRTLESYDRKRVKASRGREAQRAVGKWSKREKETDSLTCDL